MILSKPRDMAIWHDAVHGVTNSWTETELQQKRGERSQPGARQGPQLGALALFPEEMPFWPGGGCE